MHLINIIFTEKFLIFNFDHLLSFSISLKSLFFFLKKNFIFFFGLILMNPTNWLSIVNSEICLIFLPFGKETFFFKLVEKLDFLGLKFLILVKIRILWIFFHWLIIFLLDLSSFIEKKLILLLFLSFDLQFDLMLHLFLSVLKLIKDSDNH